MPRFRASNFLENEWCNVKTIFNSKSPTSIIGAGVILWLIALIISAVFGAGANILAICAIGAGLGILGIIYSSRRLTKENRASQP
jgi:FtsH-binding integral membrane protein